MSGWAAYIKNLLDSSQGIQRAAIVGYPDGSVWARSEGDREFRVIIYAVLFYNTDIHSYF
ncbi:unnamed protein product [Brugia pahangi]|uniref:Profilin n=1 Tax=Brugia pahangi TaxID=6280 RepID=A0A0N4TC23_BRUPA|nr:unnamed protein product [Brugia pahangi]